MKSLLAAAVAVMVFAGGAAQAAGCPNGANISNVTTSGTAGTRTFTITGTGFGKGPSKSSYLGDNPHFYLHDTTTGVDAGGFGDLLVVYFQSWNDSEIDIGGFGKRYGKDGYFFNPSDTVTVGVGTPNNRNSPKYCVATYSFTLP